MKVLVTGGAGYLGSVLVPVLIQGGHDVTVVDRFFFGEESLAGVVESGQVKLVRSDVRWCDGRLFDGQEAVIDLAALSNDPSGALDPWKTYEINYLGRVRVARLARQAKVQRYVLASSCSVYGFQTGILTEQSPPRPITAYAQANILAESDNLPLSGPEFSVTAVRFATLYGPSPRMRFDLAINGMVLGATRTGKIPVMRDGTQWRPFLHVQDAADALAQLLLAPASSISGQLFNVGSDDQNFQVRPLADQVAQTMSRKPAVDWYGDPDTRSYRVSFAKCRERFGFEPRLRPSDAVRDIERGLDRGAIVASPKTITVEWYRHLLSDPTSRGEVTLNGMVL